MDFRKVNKYLFLQVVTLVLLLAFFMPSYAETVLGITELEKTGDYENGEIVSLEYTEKSKGITVTTSKENNAELGKSEAIKITSSSLNPISRVEAIMYDASNMKIVNTAFYVDSKGDAKENVLSITTPEIPIEKIILKITVTDKLNVATFERTYLMKKSVLTIYSSNLNDDIASGTNLEFYADASNSSVPIKELSYVIKEGSSKILEGSYKLLDDSYYITETGKISYLNSYVSSGTGSFKSEYASSRLVASVPLNFTKSNLEIEIKASDILGNENTKIKRFNVKNIDLNFEVDKSGNVKVGDVVNCKVTSSNANFGIKKLEVTLLNENDKFISKDVSVSHVSSGDGSLTCKVSMPDVKNLKLRMEAQDTSGKVTLYGPISYNVTYNDLDITPIFVLSSEPKLMGDNELVSVTSNSGILFTSFTVKITDEYGNVIKDSDGSSKITTVSASEGKSTLSATIYYPETEKEEVYFVFNARDVYGNTYDGGNDFKNMNSTYKKGPISIYSNRITISASPQTGIINKNSKIKISSKVDVKSNPIKKIEYTYYNNEANSKLPEGTKFNLNTNYPITYKLLDGKEMYGSVRVAKVTTDIISVEPLNNLSNKINGYTLYASRPEYKNESFVASGYYEENTSKDAKVVDAPFSLYSLSTGYEVLDYGTFTESGVICEETIKGPERNATDIILSIKAIDVLGKTKVSTFNYYQNTSSVKIESIPNSGIIYSSGYIKALATPEAGRNVNSLSYIISGLDEEIKSSSTTRNEKGQIEIDFKLPEVTESKEIIISYKAVDSDNKSYTENYYYTLKPKSEMHQGANDTLKSIAGRVTAGNNEYVIEYVDENGNNQIALLSSQYKDGKDYFKTNVKDMELLSVSSINKKLEENNYPKVKKIDDIKKLYIRIKLFYDLTCKVSNNEYVDVTKVLEITKNNTNYVGIKKSSLDLGNGAKIEDILNINMRNEIIKKAQVQEVKEIDFNALGSKDEVINIYNPEKLASSAIKEKKVDVHLSFNDSYIQGKTVLNSLDFEEGKAFTNDKKEISNLVHVIINKYKLENYGIKVIDNSAHKNHTYTIKEDGTVEENCSADCIIYPEIKTVKVYYNGVKENKTLLQAVKPEYFVKYLSEAGVMESVGSGASPKVDELGRVFIKVVARYEAETLLDIASKEEFGELGIEIDSAYPNDGQIMTFEVETTGKWLYYEGLKDETTDTLKVSISPKNSDTNLYYNAKKNRYERSSDRGNAITVNVSSKAVLKNVKVLYKLEGESSYGLSKTIFAQEENGTVKQKSLIINLPEEVMLKGGLVNIKVVAEDYSGSTSDGKIYIAGQKDPIELGVFINTTKDTMPLPLVNGKSISLINSNGTVNNEVLNQIGEGKNNGTKSAFRVTKVNDTKWLGQTNEYYADNLALYYNSVNDTIGLGYKLSFSLDTVGYGTDYFNESNKESGDTLIVNVKFFGKNGTTYEELIPFIKQNESYNQCAYGSEYRQIRMIANPNINNDASHGLNSISKNGNNVTWNFSYYMPANAKFKLKNNLEGDFINVSEVLVQFDIECYKYYSIADNGDIIKNGTYNDSRHLYTLRENKWNSKKDIDSKNGITIKNVSVRLRDLINTNKGIVFWYDVDKNALFDIDGSKTY